MNTDNYNGWRNYPTWCINLWLSNDEELYREVLNLVRYNPDVSDLANVLQEFVDELLPERTGFEGDLLGYAIGQVDWYEIAQSWLEDAE